MVTLQLEILGANDVSPETRFSDRPIICRTTNELVVQTKRAFRTWRQVLFDVFGRTELKSGRVQVYVTERVVRIRLVVVGRLVDAVARGD